MISWSKHSIRYKMIRKVSQNIEAYIMVLSYQPGTKQNAPNHIQAPGNCDPGCSWLFIRFGTFALVAKIFFTTRSTNNGSVGVWTWAFGPTFGWLYTQSAKGHYSAVLLNLFGDTTTVFSGRTVDLFVISQCRRCGYFANFEGVGIVFADTAVTPQGRNYAMNRKKALVIVRSPIVANF